jgi:hypothetical protein
VNIRDFEVLLYTTECPECLDEMIGGAATAAKIVQDSSPW